MFNEEQGYVIMALKHPTIDYHRCASQLARSLRHWQPAAAICLITDNSDYTDSVFDCVRVLERTDPTNPWAEDWQIFFHSPFRETIKLEADMLIVSEIDHWWQLFRHRELVISTGCRNWKDQVSTARQYRRVFDANDLPDVYNAVTYWRRSHTAKEFFAQVKDIFTNWDVWQRTIRYAESVPSTDLVYAMAAILVGVDKVTMPFTSYPKIVHMKPFHAGIVTDNWSQELVWECHQSQLRIQTQTQWGAFHYHVKDWQP